MGKSKKKKPNLTNSKSVGRGEMNNTIENMNVNNTYGGGNMTNTTAGGGSNLQSSNAVGNSELQNAKKKVKKSGNQNKNPNGRGLM
ncbi:hypothetical protein [Maledivibacter halophilus]|uniref:Uncharacterized protein n=1 Tax=Maledivibacter halophilus TaxID=36842 RepID=A0A1T5KKC3_9FIRM|nr:hypothetical protein [Maledivibacter halophilus]SKC64120.1 hypothetical protein SAMN02194393_01900 [Maledivibacter halophilus]